VNKVLVGFQLMLQARRAWGTDRFWPLICWWHEEIHYTIPQIEEEKRVSFELERSFTGNSVGDYLGIGTTLPSTMLSVSESLFRGLSINPPGGVVAGKWRWENVEIGTSTEPSWVRKLLVWVVTGAKWIRNEKSEGRDLAPEYERLSEFLQPKNLT
jgi:hypothetical protein